MWQEQNKVSEARELLEEIYSWFTEGFDTKDLREAEALLVTLGGSVKVGEERQKAKSKRQKAEQAEGLRLKAQGLALSSPPSLQPVASSLSQSSVPSPQSLSSPVPSPQLPASTLFRPEGEYWTVSFAGMTCRLKDARGLHYIAQLLHQPHQEVHVISLFTTSADLSEEPLKTFLSGRQSPIRAHRGRRRGHAGPPGARGLQAARARVAGGTG